MQTVGNILQMITEDTQKLRDGKVTTDYANALARLTDRKSVV